jgi:hypothetical protein
MSYYINQAYLRGPLPRTPASFSLQRKRSKKNGEFLRFAQKFPFSLLLSFCKKKVDSKGVKWDFSTG